MMRAYMRLFPMLEVLYVAEEGAADRVGLLESLRKSNPTLRAVTVFSGSFLRWTADSMVCDIIINSNRSNLRSKQSTSLE